jgi:hypothetical protein
MTGGVDPVTGWLLAGMIVLLAWMGTGNTGGTGKLGRGSLLRLVDKAAKSKGANTIADTPSSPPRVSSSQAEARIAASNSAGELARETRPVGREITLRPSDHEVWSREKRGWVTPEERKKATKTRVVDEWHEGPKITNKYKISPADLEKLDVFDVGEGGRWNMIDMEKWQQYVKANKGKTEGQIAGTRWTKYLDKDGDAYYYHEDTLEKRWDPPPGLGNDTEEL